MALTLEERKLGWGVFRRALELPTDSRAAFVAGELADTPEIRTWVGELLQNHEQESPTDVIRRPLATPPFDDAALIGCSIGQYRLERIVGRGGFGTVFHAADPASPGREVAVKILDPSRAGRSGVRRFEAERQTLARLNHENIPHFYGGGVTPDGLHYFVMEFVDGAPITRFSVEHKLSLRERLELIADACAATSYAHGRFVLHRDIKPANLLVKQRADGRRIVKLLDFGIAQELAPATEPDKVSAPGPGAGPIGSFGYMSPEQAAGVPDLDVRTDVYSLGAVLFELLVQQPLRSLRDRPATAMRRMAREHIPPLVSDVALDERTRRILRGDLDAIVGKALRREREHRYAAVGELADDIGRYLRGEPTRARSPRFFDVVWQFTTRYRIVIALILTLVVLASLSTITVLVSIRANERLKTYEQLSEVLGFSLTLASEPRPDSERELLLKQLNTLADALVTKLGSDPLVAGSTHSAIGKAYLRLADFARAEHHLQLAFELRRSGAGPDAAETLASLEDLAELRLESGRAAEAGALYGAALAARNRAAGANDRDTLRSRGNLALSIDRQGRHQEAATLMRELLADQSRLLGKRDPDTLVTMNNLGNALVALDQLEEAEPLLRTVDEVRSTSGAEPDENALISMSNLANLLLKRNRPDDAAALFLRVVDARTRRLGASDPATRRAKANYVAVLSRMGRAADVEPILRELYELALRDSGSDSEDAVYAGHNLACTQMALGKLDDAVALFESVLASADRTMRDAPETAIFRGNYGQCLWKLNRLSEADAELRVALEVLTRSVGADHTQTKHVEETLRQVEQAQRGLRPN